MTMMEANGRTAGGPRQAAVPAGQRRLFVCAECRHAQLFAVQPRLICKKHGAPLEDAVLFAGQPACPHMALRRSADPVVACGSPGPGEGRA
jgi:hypothetical protein